MKKQSTGKIIMLFIIMLSALLSGCKGKDISPATERLNVEICTQKEFDLYDLEGTVFTSQEETEKIVEEYLYEVGRVINEPYWWTDINPSATKIYLNLSFGKTGRSLTEVKATKCGEDGLNAGFYLTTKNASLDKTDGRLAHEMTHMIGFMGNQSISLTEGLCDYVQAEVGFYFPEKDSFQEFMAFSLQEDYKNPEYREKWEEIISHVGTFETGYPYGEGKQLNLWYFLSHSFVRCLIDEYGIDKVKELILNGTDVSSYEEYLGTDYYELKESWLNMLLTKSEK